MELKIKRPQDFGNTFSRAESQFIYDVCKEIAAHLSDHGRKEMGETQILVYKELPRLAVREAIEKKLTRLGWFFNIEKTKSGFIITLSSKEVADTISKQATVVPPTQAQGNRDWGC